MKSIGSSRDRSVGMLMRQRQRNREPSVHTTVPHHVADHIIPHQTTLYHTGGYHAADEDRQAVLGGRSLPPAGAHLPTNVITPQ